MDDEDIVWTPPPDVVADANLTAYIQAHGLADFDDLLRRAQAEPEWWWRTIVDRLVFMRPYERLLDISEGWPFARWCVDGTTNVVANALDRHRTTPVWDNPAILGEHEDGTLRVWTTAELAAHVSRLATGLSALGVQRGEVVAIHLPSINEAIAAMLAVPKIGAVAMPLFSGFGVDAIATRLAASSAVAILTTDGTTRRGRWADMKAVADRAADAAPSVRHVVTLRRRNGEQTAPASGPRDVDWQALCEGGPDDLATVEMDAEAPALLMYTSGTSGKPKGTVHTHVGLSAKMSLDLGLLMDLKADDRIVWFSDMGWFVGPMLAYGATQAGAAFVLAEGAPDYPDTARMWRLVEAHRASVIGLAPTTVRGFMHGVGTGGHDLSSLRTCISTGEAWTPEAWWWTFTEALGRRAPILNYTGGTEIGGGILCGTHIRPMKPCTFSGPVPGTHADIVDLEGRSVPPGTVGELVLRGPSIGLTRGLWNDREGYLENYFGDIPDVWRQGDFAVRDADGFWTVLGRSDDTLKIAGKRTGPAEIEGLLAATGLVREAAAVGLPDRIKGEAVVCVVVLREGVPADGDTEATLVAAVVEGLGAPYRPKLVASVDDLPKTRNMKVMRRLVRAALRGEPPGDTSSLVNPEALDALAAIAAAHDSDKAPS